MIIGESAIYAMIVACELGFWAVLCVGLVFRYVVHSNRVSWWCLRALPFIDIALLAFTALDLRRGASATTAHGLATAYIGFTVAFGSTMIDWADREFARRFGGALGCVPAPLWGWADVRRELELWVRCLLAVAIIHVLLFVMITLLNRPDQTQPLKDWYRLSIGTAFFWFLFGPLWSLIFFKREPAPPESCVTGAGRSR